MKDGIAPSIHLKAKISVKNLSKSFGTKIVLDKLSLELFEGESLVVIGASGSGKSVLIKTILGLIPEDSGDIYVDDACVTDMSGRERHKIMNKFGMLFQGGALFDSLPIWKNVAFSLLQGTGKDGVTYRTKEARARAIEILKSVNLSPDVAPLFPSELSGGMQKRVSLARAIAGKPDIIFFDEPTTGLDPITSSTINHLINTVVKDRGMTSLTITHDMQSVRAIADRVAFLHEGKIMWQGTTKELDETDNPYVHQFIHGLSDGPIRSSY